jgi:hypothetical protein
MDKEEEDEEEEYKEGWIRMMRERTVRRIVKEMGAHGLMASLIIRQRRQKKMRASGETVHC